MFRFIKILIQKNHSLLLMSPILTLFISMRWLLEWETAVYNVLFQQKTLIMPDIYMINWMYWVLCFFLWQQELHFTKEKYQIGMWDGKSFQVVLMIEPRVKGIRRVLITYQLQGIMSRITICGITKSIRLHTMISLQEWKSNNSKQSGR